MQKYFSCVGLPTFTLLPLMMVCWGVSRCVREIKTAVLEHLAVWTLDICSLLLEFSLERVTDPLYVKFVHIVDYVRVCEWMPALLDLAWLMEYLNVGTTGSRIPSDCVVFTGFVFCFLPDSYQSYGGWITSDVINISDVFTTDTVMVKSKEKSAGVNWTNAVHRLLWLR
jgi:hypothetical protein